MSILNISISPNRALVAVDTECKVEGPDGRSTHRDGSKLLALPHAGIVVAFRGDISLASAAFGMLHEASITGFDDAAFAMPELLQSTYNRYLAVSEALRVNVIGLELALVGWSSSKGSMAGRRWQRMPKQKAFEDQPIETWAMSPDGGWFDEPAAPDTPERMARYAEDQVKTILQKDQTAGVGGRLLLAELTFEGVAIRPIAQLWRHQQ